MIVLRIPVLFICAFGASLSLSKSARRIQLQMTQMTQMTQNLEQMNPRGRRKRNLAKRSRSCQ
jgi:hypothetical protein